MRRVFSFAAAAVFAASFAVAFGGCGLFGSEEASASTTESAEYSETSDEIASYFVPATEMPTQEPTTLVTTTAATTTTTRPVATTTTKPSTAAPSQTSTTSSTAPASTTTATTAFTASPSSTLSNRVIAPLSSGNYTMSVSITDDEDDQIIKHVSGGKSAYVFKIPSAGYYCRVISLDGKYYMIAKTNTQSIYCELTSDKYNSLVALMNGCFNYDFSNLSYQSTSYELYGGQLYTKELYLRPDGRNTCLWFKSDSLKYVEEDAGTDAASKVCVSVSSGSDSSMFSIPDDCTLTAYENMVSIQMGIEMFLQ